MEMPRVVNAAKNRVTAPLETGKRAFQNFKSEGILKAAIGAGEDFGRNNRKLLSDVGVNVR